MTSILTNSAAISALQTLRSISSGMENAQRAVSTGLRITSSSDNAAYWTISTTMRSDHGALSAVYDALGLGAAKVDVAYAGMDSTIDVLSVNRRRNGTPYRLPKGTPASSCIGSARVGPGLSI
ncbi:hypothetical protein EGT36_17930 [Agrobacterium sp. FDAARGOS_525]|nr:hypothetical protein EGT36_17930 [Agrobacterium sp. FDAARGOS_525]